MQDQFFANATPQKRVPWNKGKLTGAKPPLRPKHVWSIRTKLRIEGRARDPAMFNLAIDERPLSRRRRKIGLSFLNLSTRKESLIKIVWHFFESLDVTALSLWIYDQYVNSFAVRISPLPRAKKRVA